MTPPTAGARLKRARELAGVARRALDRLARRPAGQCKLIEDRRDGAGQHTIHPDVARGYASALRVRVEWLSLGIAPMVDGVDDGDEEALRAHIRAAVAAGLEAAPEFQQEPASAEVA